MALRTLCYLPGPCTMHYLPGTSTRRVRVLVRT